MKGEVILNKGEVHRNVEGAVKANNTFKITNSVKKDIWSEFVYNHPKGNIFQTPEMYGVYERTKNYEPIFLAVVDESDNIKAMNLSMLTLLADHTYNYTIKTGSYPQIIHEHVVNVTGGKITCTEFIDANGKSYDDWIPAIRLEGG